MEQLQCYICRALIPGSLDGLANHLTTTHGLTLSREGGSQGFQCGQNSCNRRYVHFSSLRKHIRNCHLRYPDEELEENIVHDENLNHRNYDVNNDNDNDVRVNGSNAVDDAERISTPDFNNRNNDQFDLRKHVVRMIARFQCKGSITGTILTEVLFEFEQLIMATQNFFIHKIQDFFEMKGLLEDVEANDILDTLNFNNPFDGLKTLNEQIDTLQNYYNYIEPIEIPLGYRMDNILDRKTATYKPKKVMETCQYVPIIETLKLVLSSPQIRYAIQTERKSTNGELNSFLDGQYVQLHPLFSRYPDAIRIQLYYDEFDIVNPLGSKTGVHKLGAFYYTIQNLPLHMNSELNSIHVLCLCSDVDVKKYGFSTILRPFLEDLDKLESEDGVLININNDDYLLRGSIVGFCGDGLAVHDVFNLLGPSANQFCRLCMYNRNDLHAGSLNRGIDRTEGLYNEHLALLERTNFSDESITMTGVRGNCCLHSSSFFHITRNKIFDPMHDFLCGICPMILKLILYEFVVKQNYFDVSYFNARVSSFSYGYTERMNKPSANFTDAMIRRKEHTLSQKAMQMWCLMRAFPFLVSEKVSADNEHMELLLDLLQVMQIVFSPKLTYSLLPYLQALITSLFNTFRRLFPDINPINKLHHLSHYPECIMWAGPLVHYWCMRYEAKHGSIKRRAQNVCNFKNSPKTLIRICQSGQCAKWGAGDVEIWQICTPCKQIISISRTLSRSFLHDLGYNDSDEVYHSKSIRINGVEFRLNLYVCLEVAHIREDNMPLFGYIKEIISNNNNEVYLLCLICETVIFDTSLNAYRIELSDDTDLYSFIEVSNLPYHKPFCTWTDSENLYISLRHILL